MLTSDEVLRVIEAEENIRQRYVQLPGPTTPGQLARQLLDAREALRFYADVETWRVQRGYALPLPPCAAATDHGKRARACLPEHQA